MNDDEKENLEQIKKRLLKLTDFLNNDFLNYISSTPVLEPMKWDWLTNPYLYIKERESVMPLELSKKINYLFFNIFQDEANKFIDLLRERIVILNAGGSEMEIRQRIINQYNSWKVKFSDESSEIVRDIDKLTHNDKPIRIFISYAHKDEKFKDELLAHLSGLKNSGIISGWSDRELIGGEMWDEEIKDNLEKAKIILLLISASFMQSKYINEIEIKRSIERHNKGEAIVVPIIIRFSDFSSSPLSRFQALPKDVKPIESWKPRDKGWLEVINQLKRIIEKISNQN